MDFNLNKAIYHRFEQALKGDGPNVPTRFDHHQFKLWALEKSNPQPSRFRIIIKKEGFDTNYALQCLQRQLVELEDLTPKLYVSRI